MGKALMHLQCLSRNDNRSECKSLPPTLRQNPKNNAKEFALLLGSLGVNLGNKLVISLQLLC